MKITPTYLREEEDEDEDRVRFPLRPRPSARPRQPHHRGGGCGVEHRFKLLINLHRDRDDGGGKEGTREGTGKLRRGRSSAAPAAAEGVVDHLHKEYAPRFPRFSSGLPCGSAYATSLFG